MISSMQIASMKFIVSLSMFRIATFSFSIYFFFLNFVWDVLYGDEYDLSF